jgi:exopolysaccharide production protein ExoZ
LDARRRCVRRKGAAITAAATAAAPSTALPRAPGEVRSIQYLRGLAAFGVLVFHAAERAGRPFGTGAAGVDVFFVISGFIMWVVTSGRPVAPGEFLQRRVERIVPLYWGLTLLIAAAAIAVPSLFPAMQPSAAHVLKSLVFVPHADPTGLIAPLVVPGWTLNYEMFFYVLFAGALFAPVRLRPWILTLVLVGLVAARPLGDPANPVWSTYTNNLLLEFAAGVWLGRAWRDRRLPGRRAGWAMTGLGVAGFVAVGLSGIDVERARALIWGVPAFLLVAGAVSLEQAGPIPAWPPLRALGDASYSVYLVHGLAISAAFRLLQMAGVTSLPVLFAAALVAGVAAGLLAYQLAEKPLMKLFKTGMAARRDRSARPARAV